MSTGWGQTCPGNKGGASSVGGASVAGRPEWGRGSITRGGGGGAGSGAWPLLDWWPQAGSSVFVRTLNYLKLKTRGYFLSCLNIRILASRTYGWKKDAHLFGSGSRVSFRSRFSRGQPSGPGRAGAGLVQGPWCGFALGSFPLCTL